MCEDRQTEQIELTNKLLLDMIKNQKKNMSNMCRMFVISTCCLTIIIVSMIIGFFVYESQFEVTEAITTTTETITQEVSGTDSEINNIEGNLYRDNATHNE